MVHRLYPNLPLPNVNYSEGTKGNLNPSPASDWGKSIAYRLRKMVVQQSTCKQTTSKAVQSQVAVILALEIEILTTQALLVQKLN
ncbi:hypothetical protein J6590_005244 [Homalodisca vitripennis]|nr:hypothetical protein J6590_005244 [Homalodisca vitripennis]